MERELTLQNIKNEYKAFYELYAVNEVFSPLELGLPLLFSY
jgi:hypothetical protein